uniref:nucleotide exchange factor SIL1-like n=1 Tax=Styela clava TaxID=7725 RepID=UPI00193A74BA|nr:nucleotide exchange factor SIL1-like [Styela clava]
MKIMSLIDMKYERLPLLCLLCCLSVPGIYSTRDVESSDEFIPTHEWQEIKPGQAIPPGLHVKMDLQKGGKWAKLMDSESNTNTDMKSIIIKDDPIKKTPDAAKLGSSQHFKIDELKSALKKMKKEKFEETTEEQEKKIKEKFRSMDEIITAFDELKLGKETDFQVMTMLLNKFKDVNTANDVKVLALQDLEYYVHQIDNAVDFIQLDGISTMISALNNTDTNIRLEAAHVVGSAVQNNPKVQVRAMEIGALPALIRIVSDTKQPVAVRKRSIYALSSLIRNFPAAQYMFKNAGGFTALRNCFNEDEKLRLKVLSLINDLIVERKDQHLLNKNKEELMRQYKLFSLSSAINEMGFCENIMSMLNTALHDEREVLLNVMGNVHGVCKHENNYIDAAKSALEVFKEEYKQLSKSEEEQGDKDSFYHQLYKSSKDLLQIFDNDVSISKHNEL